MLLSPTKGGGQLFTRYSVLLRKEAHYSHTTQSYRGRRPTIHALLSPTKGGGPLFTHYSV